MTRGSLFGAATGSGLHVATFNIRRRLPPFRARTADDWARREPRMRAMLRTERPALLGVQEAFPDQAASVLDALGPSYRFVGYGRARGRQGEGCPLFYDSDRLELLHWSQEALSARPHVAGSRSWGALFPRVLVSAVLRERASGASFLAINTHLDPFSPRARLRSAEMIRRRAAAQVLPVLVTGDLNAGPSSAAVRELLSGGVLRDAWTAAGERVTPEWGTYARYRPPRRGARIDVIAVSASIRVSRIGIDGRPVDGGWPSDHLPVHAVVHLPEGAPS